MNILLLFLLQTHGYYAASHASASHDILISDGVIIIFCWYLVSVFITFRHKKCHKAAQMASAIEEYVLFEFIE